MKYRKEIDGLRAIAVLPVILFHAGFAIFSGGFVGVDIFFVISGYLITAIIVGQMEQGAFSLLDFYERRARRILPALFFVLLCTLPFAWFWMMPESLIGFAESLVAVPLFSSNILFYLTSGYFDTASELKPLLHTWSLAVEEQYYVLFPMLLMLVWKWGKKRIVCLLLVAAIVSLCGAQWGASAQPSLAFYLLPTRMFELLIGALLSLLPYKNQRIDPRVSQLASIAGFMLIAYAIFAFDKNTPSPSFYTLIPTVGAGLILVFSNQTNWVGKLLASKPLVGIGLISYSAYLWHQPLLAFARLRSISNPTDFLLLFLCFFSLGLGYLTWKYVETPFRNKQFIHRKTLFLCAGGLTIFLTAFGGYFYLERGITSRNGHLTKTLSPKSSFSEQRAVCHRRGNHYAALENSCILGDESHVKAALIGDSHANALSYELGIEAKKNGIGIVQLTFNGCPPIKKVYRADMDSDNQCPNFNEEAANYLRDHKNIAFIIIASRWTKFLKTEGFDNGEGGVEYTHDRLDSISEDGKRERNTESVRVKKIKEKYIDVVESYLRMGKKVILVYPIPEAGWNVPEYLAKSNLFRSPTVKSGTRYATFLERNNDAKTTLDAVGEHKNLMRISPERILCNSFVKDRCVFELNDEPLYFDYDHLSNAGARLIVPDIIHSLK